jgi:hypothetical protein
MKNLIIIIFFITFISWHPPHEPMYYQMEFNDGVIHKWSRDLYYDTKRNRERLDTVLLKKYNNKTQREITFITSKQILIDNQERLQKQMDSLLILKKQKLWIQ